MGSFRNLVVYQRATSLGDELHRVVWQWSSFDRWTVGVQMVRAADSVGANVAEAAGRRTDAEKRRFLLIARGSALELQHWLDRARARSLPLPTNAGLGAEELGRMLNGLVKATND